MTESPAFEEARSKLWWAMRDWIKSDSGANTTLPQFYRYADVVRSEMQCYLIWNTEFAAERITEPCGECPACEASVRLHEVKT